MSGGHVWQGGMNGRGKGACMVRACMAGVCVTGGCVWQGGMHGRGVCVSGVRVRQGSCMAGGHAWQGGMHGRGTCVVMGGMHGQGVGVTREVCMARGGWGMWGQRGACVTKICLVNAQVVRILLECILVY